MCLALGGFHLRGLGPLRSRDSVCPALGGGFILEGWGLRNHLVFREKLKVSKRKPPCPEPLELASQVANAGFTLADLPSRGQLLESLTGPKPHPELDQFQIPWN